MTVETPVETVEKSFPRENERRCHYCFAPITVPRRRHWCSAEHARQGRNFNRRARYQSRRRTA